MLDMALLLVWQISEPDHLAHPTTVSSIAQLCSDIHYVHLRQN